MMGIFSLISITSFQTVKNSPYLSVHFESKMTPPFENKFEMTQNTFHISVHFSGDCCTGKHKNIPLIFISFLPVFFGVLIGKFKKYPSISRDILKGVFVGVSTKKYHHGFHKP